MLKNKRPLLLMLASAALGYLVWLDNRPDGKASVAPLKDNEAGESRSARAAQEQPADGPRVPLGEAAGDPSGAHLVPPDEDHLKPGESRSAALAQAERMEVLGEDGSQPAQAQGARPIVQPGEPDAPAARPAEAESSSVMVLSNPLAKVEKESLKDWVERPLFAPTRRRPAVVDAANTKQTAAPEAAAPVYDLLGIMKEGERSLALLRKKVDGKNFRVVVGDMLGGWRVAKIEPTTVVLERADGSSQTVSLTR